MLFSNGKRNSSRLTVKAVRRTSKMMLMITSPNMSAKPIFLAVLNPVCLIIASGSPITDNSIRIFLWNIWWVGLHSISPITSSTHHVTSIFNVVEALMSAHESEDY